MCIKARLIAKSITPLELGQLQYRINIFVAVLFMVDGSNNDSRNVHQYISALEPEGILVCCMRLNAHIRKVYKENISLQFFLKYNFMTIK